MSKKKSFRLFKLCQIWYKTIAANTVRSLLSFLLYSNLFIAICAAAMAASFVFSNNKSVDLQLIAFVFSSTLASYSLHRLADLQSQQMRAYQAVLQWSYRHLLLIKVFFVLGSLASLFFFFKLNFKQQIGSFILAIITVLYSIPVPKIGWRLREIPFLKIIWIAFVWASVAVGLPLTEEVFTLHFWLLWLEVFVFVFAITLPFDLRDTHFDRQENLQTIATAFGYKKSLNIALGSCLFLFFFHSILHGISLQSLLFSSFYLFLFFLIKKIKPQRSDTFYLAYLDGSMLIFALWNLLFH